MRSASPYPSMPSRCCQGLSHGGCRHRRSSMSGERRWRSEEHTSELQSRENLSLHDALPIFARFPPGDFRSAVNGGWWNAANFQGEEDARSLLSHAVCEPISVHAQSLLSRTVTWRLPASKE